MAERAHSAEAEIDARVRDVRSRQGVVRSTLQDDDDIEPLAFVGSLAVGAGVAAVKDSIVKAIGFNLAEFRKQASNELAFNAQRAHRARSGRPGSLHRHGRKLAAKNAASQSKDARRLQDAWARVLRPLCLHETTRLQHQLEVQAGITRGPDQWQHPDSHCDRLAEQAGLIRSPAKQ